VRAEAQGAETLQPLMVPGMCQEGSCSPSRAGLVVLMDAGSGTLLAPTHALSLPFPHSFQCLHTRQLLQAMPAASGMTQKGIHSARPSAGNTACSSPAQSTQLPRPQHCHAPNPEEPFSPLRCSGLAQHCCCDPQLPDKLPATSVIGLAPRTLHSGQVKQTEPE